MTFEGWLAVGAVVLSAAIGGACLAFAVRSGRRAAAEHQRLIEAIIGGIPKPKEPTKAERIRLFNRDKRRKAPKAYSDERAYKAELDARKGGG